MKLDWNFFTTPKETVIREKGLSSFDLKCLAALSMTLDHIGAFILYDETWLRYIGRISFPIFCFLLIEGYLHTSNIIKYFVRLFVFAVISEIPFDLARCGTIFDWSYQNVIITFFLGLICVFAIDRYRLKWQSPIIILAACAAAHFSKCDGGVAGILMMLGFYIFYNNWVVKYLFEASINIFAFDNRNVQAAAIVAFIPISFYNGKPGPKNLFTKYFFYVYYPLHYVIIYLVKTYVCK